MSLRDKSLCVAMELSNKKWTLGQVIRGNTRSERTHPRNIHAKFNCCIPLCCRILSRTSDEYP